MKRSEVKKERTWNLEDIFSSDDEFEKALKNFQEAYSILATYQNKLKDEKTILELFKKRDEFDKKLMKLFAYAHMKKDQDASQDKYVGYYSKIMQIYADFSASISFITPELEELDDDFIEKMQKNKQFADYDIYLYNLRRSKKHILPKDSEELLAKLSPVISSFHEVFSMIDNLDVPFPILEYKGEKVRLSHGLYSLMLADKDVDVRKRAFDGMYGAFQALINTISANYASHVRSDCILSKIRHFDSPLERALFSEDIKKEVYNALIESVDKNLPYVHEYVKKRKALLGVDQLHMYDMYVSIFDGNELKLSYDEAYDLVIKAMEPHGKEYVDLLKKAKAERWIDVEETKGKRSGAYSTDCYGVHPYVLLNYQPTTHDVFTIAHEMGHALHTYYSDKNQPYSKADYSIFVAEVASTTNEVLLLKYLLNNAKDEKSKKYLNSYFLDMFRTTLFRQTMFSEFENSAHEFEMKGIPLTKELLCDSYYELNKKYYGQSVVHDEYIKYEWARIPHFYSSYYVYKYATGLTTAVVFAKQLLSGERKNFMKFISSGASVMPYELLKSCGIDLAKKETYENAFEEFKEALSNI